MVLALAVLLTSCAKQSPRTAAESAGGRASPEAAALTQRIAALREATAKFTGLAWVQLVTADEDRRTDAALAIERPARVRVDAMDNLADVWAQAGSDGQTVWLFLPGKEKLYEGRATARTLKRLVDFSWEPWELISFIAGTPPLSEDSQILQVGEGQFLAPQSRLQIFTDGGKGRVGRCVRPTTEGEGIDYEVRFSDYRRAGKVEFPHRMEAVFPARGARLVVEYRDVHLGKGAEAAVFLSPAERAGKTVHLNGER